MVSIEENISLSAYTTFKTGGRARFFAEVKNDTDMAAALSFARKRNLPIFVLGGGSNILIGDGGFPGLVIAIKFKSISFEPINDSRERLVVGAGENWDDVVLVAVERGLWGIENLSGIPGTVGGAVVGNIGAYGEEVKDTLDFVKAYQEETGTEKIFSASELSLSYRSSFFKSPEGRKYILVSAAFQLSKKRNPKLEYKDLAERFSGNVVAEIKEIREAVIAIRKLKLPDWKSVPTAGSYFKNPFVTEAVYQSLLARFPDMPVPRKEGGMIKISAAWLIDKVCGLKGFRSGTVSTHEKQALVVIADLGATSKEIRAFGDMLSKKVFDVTSIMLEPEVEFVGTF